MRKITLLFVMCLAAYATACTNFIVAKGASTDGSVICTYNADDYGMFQNLCHYPAGTHPKGTMRDVYDWDTNVFNQLKLNLLYISQSQSLCDLLE